MPKLARDDSNYYSYQKQKLYNYANYVSRKNAYFTESKEANRPRKRFKKKKTLLQIIISLSFWVFMMFFVMPYSFNKVTKALFVPTPYKNIKVDNQERSFPITKYLSNNWYLGEKSFNYSAGIKDAEMIPIEENVDMPALSQELTNLSKLYPKIQPAVYVYDYDTENYVNINADKLYAAASIIKIPVLIDVFKSIEAGQFSLTDTMQMSDYYKTEGSGSLQYKGERSYTIDDLARLMITESDNSATNMLISQVGSMTDVNQSIRDWGLKNTYLQSWLPDLGGTNYTTAKDMAVMLYNLEENDNLLSEESKAKIFGYMGHVHNDRLIQAGLGKDAVFLHKTGDIGTMLGDAGIVIAPNGKKYIVVILANRPHNDVTGKDYIVKASELIYNYMVK